MKWVPILWLLILAGCSQPSPTSGIITFVEADSVRYVTPEKNQPYALLWRQNNALNLWLRYSTIRACSLSPNRVAWTDYSAVLAGQKSLGSWAGSVSRATDSTVTGTFRLTEVTPDSMTGLALMASTDRCGARLDTIPLTLVRLP